MTFSIFPGCAIFEPQFSKIESWLFVQSHREFFKIFNFIYHYYSKWKGVSAFKFKKQKQKFVKFLVTIYGLSWGLTILSCCWFSTATLSEASIWFPRGQLLFLIFIDTFLWYLFDLQLHINWTRKWESRFTFKHLFIMV